MSRYMTSTNPTLEQQRRDTPDGMAHWAGTGAGGATCGRCLHHGEIGDGSKLKKDRCLKYFSMMDGKVGGVIPKSTPACRHYESAAS